VILTTLHFAGAKNTDNWCARKRESQHTFPLDVPLVPSSALAVAVDGECLSCDVFFLGETIRFGSLEFIADQFGSMSLYPMGMVQMPPSWVQPVVGYHPLCGP
jgi:hypothetical protein